MSAYGETKLCCFCLEYAQVKNPPKEFRSVNYATN